MYERLGSPGFFGVLAIVFFVGRRLLNRITYTRARKAKGCEPVARYGNVDPLLGLDLLFAMSKALKNNRFLNWQHEFYAAVGTKIKTFEANLLGSRMLYSSEPENMKAMSTSHWKDFGVEPIRQGNGALSPFTGHGTSTSDGKMWEYSRKLIQPYFDRDGYRNLDRLEVHVDHLLDNIPMDGSTVDMQPLMQRWFLDTSSDFLFGDTLGALKDPEKSDIAWAMVEVLRGVRLRLQLNRFMFLYRNKNWFDAVSRVHKYLDVHIHNALEQQAKGKPRSDRNDLLWDIAWNIKDPIAIRSQVIAVFIPSNDTTSIFISNIFYVLARHPEVWNKLRKEVEAIGSEPLTFENIRGLRYMNWVQNETHRLYPNSVQMVRVALNDTTLPVGGGADQKSPIFVQKGDVAHCNRYLMHRDPDIWGADAEVFRPERWEDIRPMWKFVPFGGGPRICPAHVLVATEASFVLVKFLQRFKAIKAMDDKPYNAVMRVGPSNIHGVKVSFTPA